MALTDFQGVYEQVLKKVGWSTADTASVAIAKEAVNDSHEAVCEAFDWPELLAKGTFNTVAPITTGTVDVTISDATVTEGTTATDDWTSPSVAGYKFSLGYAKPWFLIDSVTDSDTFELAQAWPFATATNQEFTIYEDVYSLASGVDKLYTNRVTLHAEDGRLLHRLDHSDALWWQDLPSAVGSPEYFHLIEQDSSGNFQMQLGRRIPDAVYVIVYYYKLRHVNLSADPDVPLLDESLLGVVVQGAMTRCYETPEFRDTQLAERSEARYNRMLAEKIKRRRAESPRIITPSTDAFGTNYASYPFSLPASSAE